MFQVLYRLPLHPFDMFYEIKVKKEKNWGLPALCALAAFLLATIIEFQYTDFTFNLNRVDRLNIGLMLFKTIAIFFLWVLSNWAFCTLFDGEGNLSQIFWLSAFSIIPYVVSLLVKTGLSVVLIQEEAIFLSWIVMIGYVYSGFLMITGLQIVHGFTFKKTIFSVVFTIIGIVIVLFILTLLFSLLQQFLSFFMTIFAELSIMIGG